MSTDPLILAIDDEPAILRLLKLELEDQGFTVVTAQNGEDALAVAQTNRPDLVLLDVLMPDISGLEVMRRLREQSDAPIVMVTAKDTDKDKVVGLDMGADDYVTKPFNPDELAARIRAVLRRGQGPASARVIAHGTLEIDLDSRLVRRDGEQVTLTRTEWLLLQVLAANAGRVMTNPELLSKVWGAEYRDDVQYLRVWVSRLRHKLEVNPSEPAIIKTMPGIGYMLAAGDEEAAAEESPATDAQQAPTTDDELLAPA